MRAFRFDRGGPPPRFLVFRAPSRAAGTAALALPLLCSTAPAMDVSEQLSVGGILALGTQCLRVSNAPGFDDTCESTTPFQPEVSIRPTADDEVFFKLGFAAGNGINGKSPFAIPHWAADLEDDVLNFNGRNRDHLLTAWYKHTFRQPGDGQLSATFGIIDATDYLDENAYANDEFTQFMHPVLTNAPNVFLPSYDMGGALQWGNGPWSLRAVLMEVGENDDGRDFDFYGVQAGYTVENRFGTANYRVVLAGASRDFADPTGTSLENRAGVLLSADQAFGEVVGGWLRWGWQHDEAAVNYNEIYSAGLDFDGGAWGRPGDNIGVGYAYLAGGSRDLERTHVAEAYYRWQLSDVFAATADVQYQEDDLKAGGGPSGWTAGMRLTAEF